MKMQVLFTDIANAGNHYEISDDSWLGQQEPSRISPLVADLHLQRKGDSRVAVQGFLKTRIQLTCDRCAVQYGFPVDVNFHLVLEVPSDENWQIRELECTGTDLDTVLLTEPVVDMADILRQQLYLGLPEKMICSEKCKGLCVQCGSNLNTSPCSCVEEVKESPFAILAKLKDKNN
jgi:uncharacterized protein